MNIRTVSLALSMSILSMSILSTSKRCRRPSPDQEISHALRIRSIAGGNRPGRAVRKNIKKYFQNCRNNCLIRDVVRTRRIRWTARPW